MLNIQEEIEYQKSSEGEKQKPIKPVEHPINAEQHTPVYKMHRYYVRRPWNVFEHIIKHYTEPGDIILDPFCGGGVTVVEGLKLRRKVIGVDLNPLATFITEMQVIPLDIDQFTKAFKEVEALAKEKIPPLYKTVCSKCGNKDVYAEWFEWSNVFECPICHKDVIVEKAEKIKPGVYKCTNKKCKQVFKLSETFKKREELLNLLISCKCGFNGIQNASEEDINLYQKIEKDFNKIVKKENLWYPLDEFPDGDRERDDALSQKGIKYFHQLFTKRNLLANARLLKIINDSQNDDAIKKILLFCFSGSLRFTNKMVFRSTNWQAGKPIEWAGHAYWVPDVACELNTYQSFINRYKSVIKGKENSNKFIGHFYQPTQKIDELNDYKTTFILTQSSHSLPLENESVDVVITDPPFGGNVQYAELSDFYVIWLREILKLEGIIDNKFEAIQTRHSGFESEKNSEHYEEMLFRIFKECHRVLKPNGYMVLTFHNKDINVWMSLHRAANRAGFKLPSEEISETRGILYQPPIKNYTQTFHTKASGSMLGDFILSFQKVARIGDELRISAALTPEQERKLIDKITTLLHYHAGADENTLMTVLVPFLMNDLHVFTDVANFNFDSFLKKYFDQDRKDKRWYTKEQYQRYYDPNKKKLRPIDYVPAEEFTQNIIVSFLRKKQFATIDELLSEVYTKLVNSHRPGIEAVNKVINRYCDFYEDKKTKQKGYKLKTDVTIKSKIEKPVTINQIGLFEADTIVANLSHNDTIQLLAHHASEFDFSVHIGKTEQNKIKEFRQISSPMLYKEDYGIASEKAFKKIKEIDLLVLEGNEIPAAFEVTTSIDTAREAINDRFRDLFTILPNTKIECFIIVNDNDYQKALDMLNSAANVKEGLNKKIKIMKMSFLTKDNFAHWLNKDK